MGEQDDGKAKTDLDAILSRRDFLVRGAMASVGVGSGAVVAASASGCSMAQPCLSVAYVDPDGGPERATPIAPGDTVDDVVDLGNDVVDWYRVDLSGPGQLTVTSSFEDVGAGGEVTLFDASGQQVLASGTPAVAFAVPGAYRVLVRVAVRKSASAYQLSVDFTAGN